MVILILLIPILILLINYTWISVTLFIICLFIDFPKGIDRFLSEYFSVITFFIALYVTYLNINYLANLFHKLSSLIF